MTQQVLYLELGDAQPRIALGTPGERPRDPAPLACASLDAFDANVRSVLADHGSQVVGCACSARGPETAGVFDQNGLGWAIGRDHLQKVSGASRVHLVNNFVASALAIKALEPDETEMVGGRESRLETQVGVLGPTRGLGVATLSPDGDGGWAVFAGEGGHADLAAVTDEEQAVLERMRAHVGQACAEHAVSEAGLEELYRCLTALAGTEARASASEVLARARSGEASALDATRMMSGWLGGIAGDLALHLGACSGVYLVGEVLERMGELFDRVAFRARFELKAERRDYMALVPVRLVTAPDTALIGLSTLFETRR